VEDGGSFGASRRVTGVGFYRGSTLDVFRKGTCFILSPNHTSNRRSRSYLKGDKIDLCSLLSNPDSVESIGLRLVCGPTIQGPLWRHAVGVDMLHGRCDGQARSDVLAQWQ
jgi:hypothetical protein